MSELPAPSKVRGISVIVECDYCNGARHIPGGKYRAQGEVIDCPICNGSGTESTIVPVSYLYDLLNGNIK